MQKEKTKLKNNSTYVWTLLITTAGACLSNTSRTWETRDLFGLQTGRLATPAQHRAWKEPVSPALPRSGPQHLALTGNSCLLAGAWPWSLARPSFSPAAAPAMAQQRSVSGHSLGASLPHHGPAGLTAGAGALGVTPGSLGQSAKLLTGEGRGPGELPGSRERATISWHAFEARPTITTGAASSSGVGWGSGRVPPSPCTCKLGGGREAEEQ